MTCDICGHLIKRGHELTGPSIIVIDPDDEGNPSRREDVIFKGEHMHSGCYNDLVRDTKTFVAQRINWRVHFHRNVTGL